MHVYQRIWHYFQRHRAISTIVGHVSVVAILGMLLLGNALGASLFGVFAKSPCSSGDRVYVVASGDTLGAIAAHYNVNLQRLASYNHIANPNLIYVHQTICIPKSVRPAPPPPPVKGTGNYFPPGQCTWYASKRYYQLHHIYVPLALQPWVQGAYGQGHVGVVEKILPNGRVIASSMNWGAYYWKVAYTEFSPGPGVTFITY